ncbi:MAG: hypothetical protein AB1918_03275, partial [Pseudomonadota bacterium]
PLPASRPGWRSGAVKQEMIRRVLDLRRRRPGLFAEGAYRPLPARGPRAANLLAFARQDGDGVVVVTVPLKAARLWPDGQEAPPLGPAWRGVVVEAPRRSGGGFRDLFTGVTIEPVARRGTPVFPVPDLFARFPLAVLEASSQ